MEQEVTPHLTQREKEDLCRLPYEWSTLIYLCRKIDPVLVHANEDILSFMKESGFEVSTFNMGLLPSGWDATITDELYTDELFLYPFRWRKEYDVQYGHCKFSVIIGYNASHSTYMSNNNGFFFCTVKFNAEQNLFCRRLMDKVWENCVSGPDSNLYTNRRDGLELRYFATEKTTLSQIRDFFGRFKYALREIQDLIVARDGITDIKRGPIAGLTPHEFKNALTPTDRYTFACFTGFWLNISNVCVTLEPTLRDVKKDLECYLIQSGFNIAEKLSDGTPANIGGWHCPILAEDKMEHFTSMGWERNFEMERNGHKFLVTFGFTAQADSKLPEYSERSYFNFYLEEVKPKGRILTEALAKRMKRKTPKTYMLDYYAPHKKHNPTLALEYDATPNITLNRIKAFFERVKPIIDSLKTEIDKR